MTNIAYDFIVVGSGPAGSCVASGLASSGKAPRVLLLESGGSTWDRNRFLADRYTTFMVAPDSSWAYKTVPQKHLLGRRLDYLRGKGLGGTSTINSSAWTVGPCDGFDEWARLVGDESFDWAHIRKRLQHIEAYNITENPAHAKYYKPNVADHGSAGPVSISIDDEWEGGFTGLLDTLTDAGLPMNTDINSGHPLGVGVTPATAHRHRRITAATAYLWNPPPNLTILTNATVSKVLMKDKRAVGVEVDGKKYTASYEIVLSAGSVDTAKLLMLSGIGARDELSTHGIDVVQDLPGVGRNLQDHSFAAITVQVREDAPGRGPTLLGKPSALEAARDEFEKHGTGPFTRLCNSQCMAFLSADDELQATDEFKALPSEIQDHLRMPTVPAWELITGIPPLSPNVDLTKSYLTFLIVNMLPQSTGTVSLSSADPHDAPICDPNVLSHAYDRVNLMKNVKTIMKLLQTPGIAKHVIDAVAMPTSESNDDVWKFISETAGAAWHQCGTVKMGNAEDPMACVDSRFRVRGIAGLRAADNSVPPFIPCCHTQSIAYLMGQTCAEKLIEEYYLD